MENEGKETKSHGCKNGNEINEWGVYMRKAMSRRGHRRMGGLEIDRWRKLCRAWDTHLDSHGYNDTREESMKQ